MVQIRSSAKVGVLCIACAIAGTPAFAWDDLQRMTAAQAVGSILASEEYCGLKYDQDAVSAYVEKTVPADDMEFASMLHVMTEGAKFNLQDMSESQKAAHCTQTRRVAANYGFTG
jgi:hypothetical protein